MSLTIYISGSITGVAGYRKKFAEAETLICAKFPNAEIINPTSNCVETHGLDEEQIWQAYMEISRRQVRRSNLIVYLPCWINSRGAREEISLAQHHKIKTQSITSL